MAPVLAPACDVRRRLWRTPMAKARAKLDGDSVPPERTLPATGKPAFEVPEEYAKPYVMP